MLLESSVPQVAIEKSWLNQQYEEVVDFYLEIPENNRAKLLAARSYLELDEPDEAMQLGEEINDVSIQIAGLEKQIELLESNEELDEDEREERIEELEQDLDELAK
ncbi:WXG100 protein secretion system (Wss), protein YukC [Oceanobacillus limi]|uniref:WXG100 protein secretion system (Wss), protein YukC n=1 Tax=Oceanobacillus limi TaxID=930131 RepID=A0A1I0FVT8_9BACI|nr:hypothetical protein [Oceanobacillus limi]SET62398.1 WXG100 protein secretion system (Wss), protein YukC [Oceanobacillus limi]